VSPEGVLAEGERFELSVRSLPQRRCRLPDGAFLDRAGRKAMNRSGSEAAFCGAPSQSTGRQCESRSKPPPNGERSGRADPGHHLRSRFEQQDVRGLNDASHATQRCGLQAVAGLSQPDGNPVTGGQQQRFPESEDHAARIKSDQAAHVRGQDQPEISHDRRLDRRGRHHRSTGGFS